MKRFKLILATSLMIFGISTTIVEAARQIGEFHHFKITTAFATTGHLVKHRNGNFVVNLGPSRHLAPMTVKTKLVNSNYEARSDERLVWVGERRELIIGVNKVICMLCLWHDKIGGILQPISRVVGHQIINCFNSVMQ